MSELRSTAGRLRALVKTVAALTALWLVRPVRDLFRTALWRHPVRIFTFHRISDRRSDPLTLSPAALRERVAYIKRHHDVVGLPTALAILGTGVRLRRPVAALTFDDGYLSVAELAGPIFSELEVSGCCFVPTDFVDSDRPLPHDAALASARDLTAVMRWDDLRRLERNGWSVGPHTVTHARLSELEGEGLRRELEVPMAVLRERLGATEVALAYPYGGRGDISPEAERLARELGHTACLSNYGGENLPPAGFALRRIDIGGGDLPDSIWRILTHGIDLSTWRRPRAKAQGRPAPKVASRAE